MRSWWLEDESELLSADGLRAEGVLNQRHSTQPAAYRAPLDALKREHGYVHQDEVALSPALENLEAICDKFKGEHHHDEDEVRFVLDGEGIFDIRSRDDRWMRVVVETGDLIVVPARRHHRFFLGDERQIRCVRLFKDSSGWVPHYREPVPT